MTMARKGLYEMKVKFDGSKLVELKTTKIEDLEDSFTELKRKMR